MVLLDKAPFGMKMVWLLAEMILVTKIWISLTVPMIPCASMVSPTRNGLNKMISIPPAKLDSDPCNERPTAKPAAPSMATKEELSMPSFEITVTNNNTRKAQSKISARNFESVGSKLFLTITFLTIRLVIFIAYSPIINKKTAEINLGE